MDLMPHRNVLAAEVLSDPAMLDRGVAAATSAYSAHPVALADLRADVLDQVRQEVRRAVRRFITDK